LTADPNADEPIPPSVQVWRSVREGGDTKTRKSRRTLALPLRGVVALRVQRDLQIEDREKAGKDWQDLDLVFASSAGTALDAANVRRSFRRISKTAGLNPADSTSRELRHSFVSLLSDNGVSINDIADLCGHSGTSVTEKVYRHQLRPVLLTGAAAMDRIFILDASA
jgi:integrase